MPVGGTIAGWGIPVGCMPVGPSIREWGNLTEVTRVREDRKKRMTKRKEKVRSWRRGVGGVREDDECQSKSGGFW